MIIVTQTQLRNKDTEAIILLRNEIKASFNTNVIDYFTISAVAEILYNKFKHKKHDIIYHTVVSYDGINKPFKVGDKVKFSKFAGSATGIIKYVTISNRLDNALSREPEVMIAIDGYVGLMQRFPISKIKKV